MTAAPHPDRLPARFGDILSADRDLDRYRLLASALAGRSVTVERAAEGEPSSTDGRTIRLAQGAGHDDDLAGLVVQGALLGAGSLAPELMAQLARRRTRARRYLSVEGRRVVTGLAATLPGLPLPPDVVGGGPASASPAQSLAVASGSDPVPDPPALFGAVDPRGILAVAEDEAERQTSTSEEPVRDEAVDRPARRSRPKLLERLKRRQGRREDDHASSSVAVGEGPSRHRSGRTVRVTSTGAVLEPVESDDDASSGWRYPEWDVRKGSYRPAWCTVREVEAERVALAAFDRPHAPGLQRRLARLGVGLVRERRQPQGDDLDIDAVVEAQVELLRGSSPGEGLYVESRRHKRSLSVLLLLDVSGSAGETTGAERNVHDHQREAAALLMDTLHVLGDRVAAYGFRSHGRTAVDMIRVKAFDDRLDGRVYERLGGLKPGGYTRLGAAIRHGAHVLRTRAGTERRLQVVLSDGFAYDDGYEGPYGEADARKALAEARGHGVGCLCLSLGAAIEPESLERVFGTAAHAGARDFADLERDVGRLFRTALASADLQRRLAQRRAA